MQQQSMTRWVNDQLTAQRKRLIGDGPVDYIDVIQTCIAVSARPLGNEKPLGVIGLRLFLKVEAPVAARIRTHAGKVLPIAPVRGEIIIE